MDWFHYVTQSHWFHGGVTGLLVAAAVDYRNFRSWKSVQDVLTYSWSTAALRWTQGFVGGALVGAGQGAVLG